MENCESPGHTINFRYACIGQVILSSEEEKETLFHR